MKRHFDTTTLAEKLGRGSLLSHRDLRLLRLHLINRCPTCSKAVRALTSERYGESWSPEDGLRSDLGEQLFFEALCDRGRLEQAESLALTRLRAFRDEQRDALRLLAASPDGLSEADSESLHDQPRYRTRAVCELLLAQAAQEWLTDLPRAENLLLAAQKLSRSLDKELYGEGPLKDLQARAWAGLGNIRRLQEDLSSAEEAFEEAELCLEEGTGDLLAKSEVLNLKASLRRAQWRFDEADRLIGTCIDDYESIGESHLAGRAMLKKGHFAEFRGEPEEAVRLLRKALERIDFELEPRLELMIRQLLLSCLIDIDEIDQAKALLEESRPCYEGSSDQAAMLRLPWLEGLIAKAEGDFPTAERLFQQTRETFLHRGSLETWVNISLDLAAIYAEQKRFLELKELATSLVEIFLRIGVDREAIASLALLVQASKEETVSLAQLREVARAFGKPARKTDRPS
ncbi:MAG: hypothetical protein K0U98_20435 [Deltaproteobacteria bacterium]|nr:hypothetical protein [Deltaproteobacteria bacterium]